MNKTIGISLVLLTTYLLGGCGGGGDSEPERQAVENNLTRSEIKATIVGIELENKNGERVSIQVDQL
ncbi:MAG: hypothetical protein JKY67_02400 [Pseudomonadales bacterium]|nr:hypothetical protein [Pseudomonadales bacterium]